MTPSQVLTEAAALVPLPQPASDSPSECLARTLEKTGLALEGVEIVAAP